MSASNHGFIISDGMLKFYHIGNDNKKYAYKIIPLKYITDVQLNGNIIRIKVFLTWFVYVVESPQIMYDSIWQALSKGINREVA